MSSEEQYHKNVVVNRREGRTEEKRKQDRNIETVFVFVKTEESWYQTMLGNYSPARWKLNFLHPTNLSCVGHLAANCWVVILLLTDTSLMTANGF